MMKEVVLIDCNIQPRIPSWADKISPIIQHVPCGMIDSRKFTVGNVFKEGEEYLEGGDYISRAQALEGSMNACAFDFYTKSENWEYVNWKCVPEGVNIVVFPKTIFLYSVPYSFRCVRCLCRNSFFDERNEYCRQLDRGFGRGFGVAVLED